MSASLFPHIKAVELA